MPPHILLTIDVEDWFQVENFKPWIDHSTWGSQQLRVEQNVHTLLDLFDSVNLENSTGHQSIRATFFVLGWIAERLPHLVKTIHERGHEVASHGYHHHLCSNLSDEALRKDLTDSKTLLEDLIGEQITGYRAPSFAIDDRILDVVKQCGYRYDSSYNSFDRHERYGRIDLSGKQNIGVACKLSETFYELPVSNFKVGNQILPWGGGGYFRLIPLFLMKAGVRSILSRDKAFLFYTHPWEFDPEQPRVINASGYKKFRHYVNLKNTYSKLRSFIDAFKHCQLITLRDYLIEHALTLENGEWNKTI
ncbi:MAG: DUF3473 domain-containing protein [Proteobacteria bacterium]|nr:DUF3473 domain-containing protein [Pseudomonadota bacterium]